MEGSYNQIRRRAVKFHFYLDFYLRTAHASSYPAEARRHAQLSENCGNSRLFQTARVPRAHVCAFTCAFHERARGGTRTAGGKGGKGGNRLQQSRVANSSTISSTSRCSGPTIDRPETGGNRRKPADTPCTNLRSGTRCDRPAHGRGDLYANPRQILEPVLGLHVRLDLGREGVRVGVVHHPDQHGVVAHLLVAAGP